MAKENQNNKDLKKITAHDFYFETPLYEFILSSQFVDKIHSGEVRAYSAKNEFPTTYTIESANIYTSYKQIHHIKLKCKQKEDDILEFFIYNDRKIVFKIGQFPSLADLQCAEINKKYNKILSKNDLHDLKKAIGIMSHGAGAGSLVYLRRIFEGIIWDTYQNNKSKLNTVEKEFKNKRMDEKINFLKDCLPEQLLEMKDIYGILSKGIHELSEQDCLKYFPILKLSITLILDGKIEQATKIKKDAEVKKQMDKIRKEVNKK